MQMASIRISIATICFIPFMIKFIRGIDLKSWVQLGIVGLCGSGLPAYLFAFAETSVSSSAAGILNALTAIFAFIIGIVFYKVVFQARQMLGVLIGFGGAMLVILAGNQGELFSDIRYSLLIVLATIMYATSVNTVKSHFQHWSPLKINAGVFVLIGIPALVHVLCSDFITVMSTHEEAWSSLGFIAILSIGSTFLANILFFYLVQWTDAIFAATISYFIPLIALFWGFVDGEIITINHFLGMLLILGGVYLTKRK